MIGGVCESANGLIPNSSIPPIPQFPKFPKFLNSSIPQFLNYEIQHQWVIPYTT